MLCIARSFGLGDKTLTFLAFLARVLSSMGKAPTAPPPAVVEPTVAKDKADKPAD